MDEAVRAVFRFCPELPYWPQLPKRATTEGIDEQAAEGFPGLSWQGSRMIVTQNEEFFLAVERLLERREREDAADCAMSPEYAAGFPAFVDALPTNAVGQAKGQIAGPVTVGMSVFDEQGKPILYDAAMREVLTEHLWLKVKWQSAALERAGQLPVIFVDEPYLAISGTSSFPWGADDIRALLEAVYRAAPITGTHCCGNMDWSVLLASSVDIVSFDAFAFSKNFMLYSEDIVHFLSRGGNIAWGLVPTDHDDLAGTSVDQLQEALEGMVGKIADIGVDRARVWRQSLVTPACGLGTRPAETARRALDMTYELSLRLKQAHSVDLSTDRESL